jgi:hypothetical protein
MLQHAIDFLVPHKPHTGCASPEYFQGQAARYACSTVNRNIYFINTYTKYQKLLHVKEPIYQQRKATNNNNDAANVIKCNSSSAKGIIK